MQLQIICSFFYFSAPLTFYNTTAVCLAAHSCCAANAPNLSFALSLPLSLPKLRKKNHSHSLAALTPTCAQSLAEGSKWSSSGKYIAANQNSSGNSNSFLCPPLYIQTHTFAESVHLRLASELAHIYICVLMCVCVLYMLLLLFYINMLCVHIHINIYSKIAWFQLFYFILPLNGK